MSLRPSEDPRHKSSSWRSLSDLFRIGRRRGLAAQVRLGQAYQAVFYGNPTREDQAIVLADIANKSGFYRVTDAKSSTSRELWQAEGARLLYGTTVYAHLTLSEADRTALETAARREAAVDNDPREGNT